MICKIFGHNYQPRYHKGPATHVFNSVKGDIDALEGLSNIIEQYRNVTYVYDVCTKCGDINHMENKV